PLKKDKIVVNFIHRRYDKSRECVFSANEMASFWHLPLPWTETPNILWLPSRKASVPADIPREGLILGVNRFRGVETEIRIMREDRRRHVYMIGKSGVGKSVLLENMAIQDIQNGEGVCVIDPHGDLVEHILTHVPKERAQDVVYFNPSDIEHPLGLNMLEAETPDQRDFVAQEMISIFYKLFPPEMIGPIFEHNMRNVMLTLMEGEPGNRGTIAEIPRMFTDTVFQKRRVALVKDPIVRSFWEKEMAKTADFHKSEMLGYIISKVGRFVENSMMRNIIGQEKSGFDVFDIMNNRKILLVNLSKGTTGEVNSSLLGLIIVSKLQMAALRRATLPEDQRNDFYLYVDEFQNFVTDSIATILSEARKYRLNLIIAHQYISQLVDGNDTKIRDAVFGNAGTTIAFRVGSEDAAALEKEFEPVFTAYDLINMEKYTAAIKLLINNTGSRPFTMQTLSPQQGNPTYATALKEMSRMTYGKERHVVEKEILERTQLGVTGAPLPSMQTERKV
ncbi:MAG: type IV secretion system DNA-binding domain-containing protein, partial [Patescibacteria group bacterium]